MKRFEPGNTVPQAMSAFRHDTRGTVSVETIIILPILLWALVATAVFYDAFRTRTQAQSAAFTVADLISRETEMLTGSYLEGMNGVFDFLASSRTQTRMRISAVTWSSARDELDLVWSYGTRQLPPLTPADLRGGSGAQGGGVASAGLNFDSAAMQQPGSDLAQRIPPVAPGEMLVVVESFALWSPFTSVLLSPMRFAPLVVARPRFTPWLNLEDAIDFTRGDYDDDEAWETENPADGNAGASVQTEGPPVIVTSQNFVSGPFAGWSESRTGSGQGGLRFQGPFGGETLASPVSYAVVLPQGTARARIEFDLLVIDTWDGYSGSSINAHGDTLTLMIDGRPISVDAFRPGHAVFYPNARQHRVTIAGASYRVAMTRVQAGSNLAGGSAHDERWRVVITADAPPPGFALGFSASLNEAIGNESFGIADFSVTAYPGTAQPAAFSPPEEARIGAHAQTRFPVFDGCPDFRISGPALTLRNSDLTAPLRLLRQTSGQTDANRCREVDGKRFFHASPTYVMFYDSQDQRGSGRRLRIAIDDKASDRNCEPAILVRDPQGQWFFSDKKDGRLNLGNASDGEYQIFLGARRSGDSCNVMLEISRY